MQVMQKHQKYFALRDDTGRLLPYFIAVSFIWSAKMIHNVIVAKHYNKLHMVPQVANGVIDVKLVKKGNEAVLR